MRVMLGSRVALEVNGERSVVNLVSDATYQNTKPKEWRKRGMVQASSPMGLAMVGREVGEVFTFQTPGGEKDCTILEVH